MNKAIRKIFCMVLAITLILPSSAVFASVSSEEARELYLEKTLSLAEQVEYNGGAFNASNLYFCDVTKDGIEDGFVNLNCSNSYMAWGLVFMTVRNGKAKVVQKIGVGRYLQHVKYRKKSASLEIYRYGHGTERYIYYKFNGKKFKCVAAKSRVSITGGAQENGPWIYLKKGKNDQQISAKQFKNLTKNLTKGKVTVII